MSGTSTTRAMTSPDLRTADFPFPNLLPLINVPFVLLSTQVMDVSLQEALLFQDISQWFVLTLRSSVRQLQAGCRPKLNTGEVGLRQCKPHRLVSVHQCLPKSPSILAAMSSTTAKFEIPGPDEPVARLPARHCAGTVQTISGPQFSVSSCKTYQCSTGTQSEPQSHVAENPVTSRCRYTI
jgi:hypothetical protein